MISLQSLSVFSPSRSKTWPHESDVRSTRFLTLHQETLNRLVIATKSETLKLLLPQSGEWLETLRVSGTNLDIGEEPRAHVQARIEPEGSAFPNDRTLRRSSSNMLHRLKR
jgi:hypothetical protein